MRRVAAAGAAANPKLGEGEDPAQRIVFYRFGM